MAQLWRLRIALMLAACGLATWAWAETIEFVTYYPAPTAAGTASSQSMAVGSGYNGTTPADGELLVFDRIGIGPGFNTTQPAPRLDIQAGAARITMDAAADPAQQLFIRGATDNGEGISVGFNTTGNYASIQSYGGGTTGGDLFLQKQAGNVKIGAVAPGGQGRLQVYEPSGFYAGYFQGQTIGLYGTGGNTGVRGNSSNIGVYGYGSAYGLYGNSTNNIGVYGTGPTYGVYGGSTNTGIYGSGNIGVYGNSSGPYGVYGISYAPLGNGIYGVGIYGVHGVSNAAGIGAGVGVYAENSNGSGVYSRTNASGSPSMYAYNAGSGRWIGLAWNSWGLDTNGDIRTTGYLYGTLACSKEFKKNIVPLSARDEAAILGQIENLPLVHFLYKTDKDDRPVRLGVIAETAPQDIKSDNGKGLEPAAYSALSLAGVKALSAQVQQQQEEIRKLKQQFEQIKKEQGR